MQNIIDTLVLLLTQRWYVFLFLSAYFGIATQHWGFRRSLKLFVIGYAVAWASEASSIRNGFPYGDYSYNYGAMPGEPMLAGVPIWDSMSYVFLSFAGWCLSLWLASRWNPTLSLQQLQRSWKTLIGAAFWTMILDVVIDPVANLGQHWFLGDVYDYPHGGLYFGVPLSNFAGWFLTVFAIVALFRLSDSLEDVPRKNSRLWLGVGLYFGVYAFNLGVTLYLRQWWLALASLGWGILILALFRKSPSPSVELQESETMNLSQS